MAYTNIDLPTEYFETKLYTGTGATQSITGLNFAPDWVWLKQRNGTYGHDLYDIIRGATKTINTNNTNAEYTSTDRLTSFNSDGFTLGSGVAVNGSGDTYVSWNWKANGAGVSNTSGSITSTVSANTTAGFSIVSYTGTGANATVGHGLGVAPKMVIIKNRGDVSNWPVFHSGLSGNSYYIYLNKTDAQSNVNAMWNNTAPTSTVFSLGTSTDSNQSSTAMIAYCFAEVKGYSKFSSYTGNGSADGTFVYTGFKPAMIIAKQSNGGQAWQIHDNARDTFNLATRVLFPNNSNAEQNSSANGALDILSNGFKWRMADSDQNGSGDTYIYMAFAENPFVTSKGIPTTAR